MYTHTIYKHAYMYALYPAHVHLYIRALLPFRDYSFVHSGLGSVVTHWGTCYKAKFDELWCCCFQELHWHKCQVNLMPNSEQHCPSPVSRLLVVTAAWSHDTICGTMKDMGKLNHQKMYITICVTATPKTHTPCNRSEPSGTTHALTFTSPTSPFTTLGLYLHLMYTFLAADIRTWGQTILSLVCSTL
jgi:hypothetical protein